MKIPAFLRSFAVLTTLAIGAALLPASLHAQQLPASQMETPEVVAGPRAATAGISNVVQAAPALPGEAPYLQDSMGNGPNVAMMLVGGAAIVVGSIVGGDGGQIIMISGAVIGLIGLFRYLR
jgi:hypothetical protein